MEERLTPTTTEDETMIIATGSTYNVKEDLKAAGFVWNKEDRVWEAKSFDAEIWAKRCDVSWNGRKQGRLCSEIKITEV